MKKIRIEAKLSEDQLADLGVFEWDVWTKEISEFPWTYTDKETCYFLEGEVTITPDEGDPVTVGGGDLVIFPKGMSCTWNITKNVRKRFTYG
jgi:uncharacterized cupin superfamily protein